MERPPARLFENDLDGMVELPKERLLRSDAALAVPVTLLLDFFTGFFEESGGDWSSVRAMEVSAQLLPGDRLHASGAVVRHAARNLGRPRVFDIVVTGLFETLQQQSGKLRAIFGREVGRLVVQVANSFAHASYDTRAA
jgi:hypothetical protein